MVTKLDYNGTLSALQGMLGERVAVAILARGSSGTEMVVALMAGALRDGQTMDTDAYRRRATSGVSFAVVKNLDDGPGSQSTFHLAEGHFTSGEFHPDDRHVEIHQGSVRIVVLLQGA